MKSKIYCLYKQFLVYCCSIFAVYGFGSDTFTRPEARFPYDVSFAYFKGPSNAQLRVAIDYNGEGTGIVIVIE